MDTPNHYELLCVTPDATADDIRAAYRRLVRMYHPDLAGVAGAAMTLRLNEAQRVLLDPDLRSRVDRPGFHSSEPRSTARTPSPAPRYASDFPTRHAPYRPAARPAPADQRSAVWDTLAILSVAVIVFSTIAVFTVAYSGPVGGVSPRLIPPIVIAMVWMAAGLSRPPRVIFFLLGTSMLLWPLAILEVGPFASLVNASPVWIWALLTASFVSTILLRLASPHVSRYSARRPASGHASAA